MTKIACYLNTAEDTDDPKFKLHAITGLGTWQREAAVRITEKKKKKMTLKGYSKVCLLLTCMHLESNVSDYVRVAVIMSAKMPNTSNFWNKHVSKRPDQISQSYVLNSSVGRKAFDNNTAVLRKLAQSGEQ